MSFDTSDEIVCRDLLVDENTTRKVCSREPWLGLIINKNALIRENKPLEISINLTTLTKIVLRVLGIKPMKTFGKKVVIAYIDPDGKPRKEVLIKLDSNDWYRVYSYKLPKIIALPLSEIHRFGLYLIINTTGIVVNLLSFIVVYEALLSKISQDVLRNIASITGFESSVLYNFALNELITFKNTGLSRAPKKILERLVKYHGASIASWVSQITMVNILPLVLGLEPWMSQFIGIIIGFILNFILGYVYTWSKHRLT